jgi:hypothetical protein
MKIKVRFKVELSGWVEVTRDITHDVDTFDATKVDTYGTDEHRLLDLMADQALELAAEQLDGEVYDTEILEVTP